ncbi:MAG: hypothetical protein Q9162_005516 [Coniocarpon cinnabarinum]
MGAFLAAPIVTAVVGTAGVAATLGTGIPIYKEMRRENAEDRRRAVHEGTAEMLNALSNDQLLSMVPQVALDAMPQQPELWKRCNAGGEVRSVADSSAGPWMLVDTSEVANSTASGAMDNGTVHGLYNVEWLHAYAKSREVGAPALRPRASNALQAQTLAMASAIESLAEGLDTFQHGESKKVGENAYTTSFDAGLEALEEAVRKTLDVKLGTFKMKR